MAYSVDLRQRVLAALQRGTSQTDVSDTFTVSVATIKRWLARERAGQSLTPRHSSGRKHGIGDDELALLRTRLQAEPDATLAAHTQWWNDTHPERHISSGALNRAIGRLGWSRKKRPFTQANKTKTHV